jgi:hypothetical protein
MLMTLTKEEQFYADSLALLNRSAIPFLVGGTFAVNAYTGIDRATKDMDFFCKASDFPKIFHLFSDAGYRTRIEDERWLAKAFSGEHFVDIIFSSANAVTPVREEWFKDARVINLYGMDVRVLPATELIWSKVFVQDRYKYDGADVAHLFLIEHERIDWQRLLSYAEQHWEVLLIHVLNFRFIYPSERELIPRWFLDELLARLHNHILLPTSHTKVCRGRLFSRDDYAVDVFKWGFADVVGTPGEHKK